MGAVINEMAKSLNESRMEERKQGKAIAYELNAILKILNDQGIIIKILGKTVEAKEFLYEGNGVINIRCGKEGY